MDVEDGRAIDEVELNVSEVLWDGLNSITALEILVPSAGNRKESSLNVYGIWRTLGAGLRVRQKKLELPEPSPTVDVTMYMYLGRWPTSARWVKYWLGD